ALPGIDVADFIHGVPRVHGRGSEGVADSGIALCRKPGRAPRARSAEADAPNAELSDDIIDVVVLRGTVHGETGDGDGCGVDLACGEDVVPGDGGLLGAVVEVRAEAG